MSLQVTPIDFAEANAFVSKYHRHHKPMPGVKFCVAVSEGEAVRGVAMVGRPVARNSDNGWTLEVNRVCVDKALDALTVPALQSSLRSAWCGATSAADDWRPSNPARGQCAVTALIVQDVLGGELIRVEYQDGDERGSHYYNKLPSGEVLDLTASQFSDPITTNAQGRTREYLLSNESTRSRYNRLRAKVLPSSNACSMLYGAAWRAAKALGYKRLITYTLPAEGGASLRAAGWKLIGERGGGNWNVPSRPRIDTAETLRGQKLLWEAA